MKNSNASYTSNVIIHPALQGFLIKSGVAGNGLFTTYTVTNLHSYQVACLNNAPTAFYTTLTSNSWQIGGVVF